jgi:uncharacterized membrane protein (UPF0127 family)
MPVLVEAATLLAAAAPLRRAVEALGGAAALGAVALVTDGELGALTFPPGEVAGRAVARLRAAGLTLLRDGEPGELAAVGQRMGPVAWWPWLELALVPAPGGGGPVLAARLAGSAGREVATPPGWRFAGSESERMGPCELRLADRPLRHLRREPGCDVYLDRFTGEEVRLEREHAPVRVVVEGPGGRGEVLAELVSRDEEVEVGLMFREALPEGAGMLFRFDRVGPHRFWMKNTLASLDLLFVAADGRVANVAARTTPLSQRFHWSAGPVRAVLEVPAGWCEAHGVAAGARIRVGAPAVR